MKRGQREISLMKNRRGQFYLIAAIIIIAVLFGLVAVTNYVKEKPSSIKYYDLDSELKLESEQVINYGIINSQEVNGLLESFSTSYADYINQGEQANLYFIYGDEETIHTLAYKTDESQGGVSLDLGGNAPIKKSIESRSIEKDEKNVAGEKNVKITLGETDYNLEVKKGNNFYFIIKEPVNN